ncbi:hypothetical protein [Azospirillum argentinense]|uniref:AAA family ATPase n=1 Tax=Azospirillum argentinense TaxID=2970906 RepID=UPI0032DF3D6D
MARSADDFRLRFAALSQAAVGVVQVRTREPYRAADALLDHAIAEGMDLRVWSVASGWQSHGADDPGDGAAEPAAALRVAMAASSDALFAMVHPHRLLARDPVAVQLVKEAARTFPLDGRRLILLTPPSADLPDEIRDDVAVLDLALPSAEERRDAYDGLVAPLGLKAPRFDDAAIERLLAAGAGMTMSEFEVAVSRALVALRDMLPDADPDAFVALVTAVKVESVRRSEVLEIVPTDAVGEVGGLGALKAWLSKRARCFGPEARAYGIEPPKGMALVGPPGTGKSASARAAARMLGLPLVRFDLSRVFASLVGQSEQRLRDALLLVEAIAPCVLFVDEVDKLFDQRSAGGDSGVGRRVLGAFLGWLQDTRAAVFTVFTANRVDGLPAELLRRGRVDEVFSVTLPHPAERLEILRIHLARRGRDPDAVARLDLAVMASDGFAPAEIEAAVKDALIEAFTTGRDVDGALVAEVLRGMVPLSISFADQVTAMRRWAELNARPASLPLNLELHNLEIIPEPHRIPITRFRD